MRKVLKNDKELQEIHAKLVKMLGNIDNQASHLGTILWASKIIAEDLMERTSPYALRREVQYALAQIMHNLFLIHFPYHVSEMNDDHQDYFESGHLDDRFAMVVKQLYNICKEEKLL